MGVAGREPGPGPEEPPRTATPARLVQDQKRPGDGEQWPSKKRLFPRARQEQRKRMSDIGAPSTTRLRAQKNGGHSKIPRCAGQE